LGIAGLIGYGILRASNPRYVYEDTFRERPSGDVVGIRSKTFSFADEGHVFMSFKGSPETVHRVVPKELKKVSYAEYCREMPGNNSNEKTTEIYLLVSDLGAGRRFASESTLMTYDTETKTVMYSSLGSTDSAKSINWPARNLLI
jgi:hypothetical protein